MSPFHGLEDIVETKFQRDGVIVQPVNHLISFRGRDTMSRDHSIRNSQKERQRFFESDDRKKEDDSDIDQFVRTLVEEEMKAAREKTPNR